MRQGGTSMRREKRHPTVEDGVTVGADASIMGPITVGENASVGAGAVVVDDVPPETEPPNADVATGDSAGASAPDDGGAEPAGGSAEPAADAHGIGPAPLDEAAFVEFARERLAGFKIPKTVAYTDELPRTVSGTVDRQATRALLRERGADPREDADADLETAGFEPADPAEPPEEATPDGADASGPDSPGADGDSDTDDDAVDIADAEEVAGESAADAGGDEAGDADAGDGPDASDDSE